MRAGQALRQGAADTNVFHVQPCSHATPTEMPHTAAAVVKERMLSLPKTSASHPSMTTQGAVQVEGQCAK